MPNPQLPISPEAALEIQQALDRKRALPPSFRGRSRVALARAAGLLPSAPVFEESVTAPDAGAFNPDEAIVKLFDRPSLLVQNDRLTDPESDVWRRRLSIFRPVIEPTLPSVGRLELQNSDDLDWVGTAWMIGKDIAITNRHVALAFTDVTQQGGYEPKYGFFAKKPVQARVDFAEESGVTRASEIEVAQVLYIASTGAADPDIALLQMKPNPNLPPPIELGDDPAVNDWVGLVGYPARDSRNDADAQAQIFGEIFDVKRFAPGQVMAGDDGFVFRHDASSLGGNSGSVVLSLATGRAVGLHFGGRFMQANFAVRVSKIKEILRQQNIQVAVPPMLESTKPFGGEESVEEAAQGDPTHKPAYFDGRAGYDEAFLGEGFEVPWPGMDAWKSDLAPVVGAADGSHRLDYTHFSVVICKSRRMALVTAVNVDGSAWRSLNRSKEGGTWYLDGRVDRKYQLGNLDAYDHNKLDKGHQVRREDPNWGSEDEAKMGNSDTFHYTNSCPQHKDLNQKTWLELESYLLDTAKAKGLKLTVFTGPVLREDDFAYREIQVPAEFFKVAVVVDEETGKLEATGYLQSQTNYLDDIDEDVLNGGSTYQVPIAHLEEITKLDFGKLRQFDPMRGTDESKGFPGRRVRRPTDIRHR